MSKVKYAKFRLSRRVGKSIHGHPQDAINFRNYFCGQHGQTSIRKNSEYATQLIAKQAIIAGIKKIDLLLSRDNCQLKLI